MVTCSYGHMFLWSYVCLRTESEIFRQPAKVLAFTNDWNAKCCFPQGDQICGGGPLVPLGHISASRFGSVGPNPRGCHSGFGPLQMWSGRTIFVSLDQICTWIWSRGIKSPSGLVNSIFFRSPLVEEIYLNWLTFYEWWDIFSTNHRNQLIF